ncbi:MAG: hypothetical protein J3Q66DRAFT_327569 [Benniella sp.]|nr:MAG: hypothetical protein J3Q66DRAFT_327569 [Benniella sp.]
MVKLTLPLLDNTDNESVNSTLDCDPSQSIYDNRSCIKDTLFCSDDNPCPSGSSCIDRVCQCQSDSPSFITLTPPPMRMYTMGCNFNTKREVETCREYEYGVEKTCLLNYCSKEVPCYAGRCDTSRNVCVNITSQTIPLPKSESAVVILGADPLGQQETTFSPVLIILMAAGAVVALAIAGCIIRTLILWTKSSVAWASGSSRVDCEKNGDGADGDNEPTKPAKFTGPHYIPPPPPISNEISPFATPLPSPHFSPYTQPNHSQANSSSSSFMNPFRRGALEDNASTVSIEMDSCRTPATNGHVSVFVTPPPPAAGGVRSGPGFGSGTDPKMSRSVTVSPGTTSNRNSQYGSGLHKSASMQQLGSRTPPPPPTMRQPSTSSPIPSIAISLPLSGPSSLPCDAGILRTPSLSLDSLIDPASPTSPSFRQGSFSPQMTPRSSSEPILVIQSGAERLPALTIQPSQAMLRHSASVPQMFVSSPLGTSPPITPISPTRRILPPGFESSPVTGA